VKDFIRIGGKFNVKAMVLGAKGPAMFVKRSEFPWPMFILY
jgi:hypothetical protein